MTTSGAPELHLRTLLERSSDGYLLVDGSGLVEHANVAARVALATEGEAPVGQPVHRWLPELVLRTDSPVTDVESHMISANEDRFPVEVSVVTVDEERGQFWVVFRDISRRKGLEGSVRAHADELERMVDLRSRELKQLRERTRRQWDHAPVLELAIDSEGAIASANRKACLSLGVTADRLVGMPLADFAAGDRRAALEDAVRKMGAGSPAPYETQLRSADGSILDVLLHPVEGGGEKRGTLRILGLDVTARREAERLVDQSLELAESQRARMERILRGIGEGVVVTDPDGQVRLMNQIAERFLDIDEPFAFGRDLFAEQRDLEFSATWREFTEGGDDIRVQELKLGGATERTFTVTMSRIRTEEGRPAGCVAVLRDVTRERQIEKMKRDFVSNITHELRTPLASIRGFTTTILRGEDVGEGDRVRFLGIVEKEAKRLQRLVEDLLTLSRLEDGRETLNLRPADLRDVLEDAHRDLAEAAERRGLEIELRSAGCNGAGVFDPDKIRRVVDNLVGNALKYTPTGGRVTVEMNRVGERLEVAVTDTGRGIEPELLERIFDRFYTSNPARGNPHGSGLGLHIVRRLLDLHGGEVEAESRPGEGSTFRFAFPAVPQAQAPKLRPPAAGGEGDKLRSDPFVDDPDDGENSGEPLLTTAPAPTEDAGPNGESLGSGDVELVSSEGRRSGRDFRIPFPTAPGAPTLEEALTDDPDGPTDDPLSD